MKKTLFFALGIGRATVLCNNAELVNPCKARPRRNAHARPKRARSFEFAVVSPLPTN